MEIKQAIDILSKAWKESVGHNAYQSHAKLDLEDALDMAITALREKQQRDNPEPLTLEQLRGMDGEPVWIELPDVGSFYALVELRPGKVFVRSLYGANRPVDLIHHQKGVIYCHKPADTGIKRGDDNL